MLRNITKILAILLISSFSQSDQKYTKPFPELFSHKSHEKIFLQSSIKCLECHSFSVKSKAQDPLGLPVAGGFIQGSRTRCHECHLGKVNFPRPNQCVLCHRDVVRLMPEDHHRSWMFRHGKIAQMNKESCVACHSTNTCSECHIKRQSQKPTVHPPNYRIFHSVQARANPQSCMSCHSTQNSCTQCHQKGGL
ncbi:MAG: cytochrome c3 family protein [Bdellovibrionales bacterium]